MNKLKSTNGVTIITLVITIIIMLILVSISIKGLNGKNGTFLKAGEIERQNEYKTELQVIGIELQHNILTENLTPERYMEKYQQKIKENEKFKEAKLIELIQKTIKVETKEGDKFIITEEDVQLIEGEFP